MIRVLLTLSLLFWSCIAQAQMIGNRQVVLLNPQVRPDNASAGLPSVDDNWAVGGYPYAGGVCAEWGHRVPCNNHISTTRAQTVSSYCTSTDGMLAAVNANVARLCNGNGLLIEEARTNSALWARDMTNAAWVKVGMGNALNAVGADGTANAATTLTATGTAGSCTASCTILQTLTLGSAADTYSVYLRRVTGSGAVNITINNLVGTTACTLVTTGFTRCTVTATLANPVIGVQLTTLNDVVVADFNQLEAGSFVTSAIPTTTVSATRAVDVITPSTVITTAWQSPSGFVYFQQTGNGTTGTPSNIPLVRKQSSPINIPLVADSGNIRIYANGTNTDVALGSGAWTSGRVKSAASWDGSGVSVVGNNGTVGTGSQVMGTVSPDANISGYKAIYLERFTVGIIKPSDVVLKAMTQ